MTGIRLEMPPMFFKSYEATRDNQQDGEDHFDYFLDAIEAGVLQPDYDIVIMDGWSAHTGGRGQELQNFLIEDYGIPFVQLAARMSHLNSSEHSWRRSKSWARTVVSEHDWIEQPTMARTLIAEGLRRITHSDILADMMHDGYGVEQDTIDRVMKYGLPRSKRYVRQPTPLW
jgi:hypothetical protein